LEGYRLDSEHWQEKIVVKGILDVEDAKIAARLGVPAIVISNHGERRLNGELSSARLEPMRRVQLAARFPGV
jgi:L-lactate dehydrogenase (cytochrome)